MKNYEKKECVFYAKGERMEDEKLHALVEKLHFVLTRNDYVCIDDFLVDRKIKVSEKNKQKLVNAVNLNKHLIQKCYGKIYVYDPTEVHLSFMGKRLHKIIKAVNDINESRNPEQKELDSVTKMREEQALDIAFERQMKRVTLNYYYRGQVDSNFYLLPSIFRTQRYLENEDKMHYELQIKCPQDFEKAKSHLDILTTMQHYSMPTRLLDVTTNLLVAIFFAVDSIKDSDGEIIIFNQKPDDVLYYDNDTIEIACAMAKFTFEDKLNLKHLAEKFVRDYEKQIEPIQIRLHEELKIIQNEELRTARNRLANQELHQIYLAVMEKFNEQYEVQQMLKKIGRNMNNQGLQMDPMQLVKPHFVKPLQNNNRIIRQSGAFIVGGLQNSDDCISSLNQLRLRNADGLKVKIIIPQAHKKGIKQALNIVGINESTIYPEIDRVSTYLKSLYR